MRISPISAKDKIYFSETAGTTSIYLVEVEGRPVMRILANTSDPNQRIAITRADGTGFQWTTGQFQMKTEGEQLIEDADGNPVGVLAGQQRVSGVSVYTYVVPRMVRLIARLLDPIEA